MQPIIIIKIVFQIDINMAEISLYIIAIIAMVVFFIMSLLIFFLQRFCRHPQADIHQHSMQSNRQSSLTNIAFETNREEIKLHQNIQIQFSSQYQQQISNHKRLSLTNSFLLPHEFGAHQQRRNSQLSVTSSRSGSSEVRREIGSPSSGDTKKLVRFDNVCGSSGRSSGSPPRKMSYSYKVNNGYHPSTKRPLKPILKSPTMHTFQSYDGYDPMSSNGLRICRIARKTAETIV